eukprot:666516-Ditylum_brightwellii.AAC.1
MESKVAEMVEAQTKDYLATMLQQMEVNNSSPQMGNMCSAPLSQMQVAENTVDRKKAAKIEEVYGHIMDEKCPDASKVDNRSLKKKVWVTMKNISAPLVCKKTAQNKIMSAPCAKSPPQKKK